MMRWLVIAVFLGSACGCAKRELPEIVVNASSGAAFARFQADLAEKFGAEQLQPLDVAIEELKLEAMNQGVEGVAARERQMLAAIDGKTVHEAWLLGWRARQRRLRGEIAEMTALLERDTKLRQQGGTSQTLLNRLQNERDIIARLQRDLTDAAQRLLGWGATPEPSSSSQTATPAATEHDR